MAQVDFTRLDADYGRDVYKNAPNRHLVNCNRLDGDLQKVEDSLNRLAAALMVILRDDNRCPIDSEEHWYFESVVLKKIFDYFGEKFNKLEVLEKALAQITGTGGRLEKLEDALKALQDAVEALKNREIIPLTVTETSPNHFYDGELSHAVDRASLTVRGITRLNDSTDSQAVDEAATANALRKLKIQLAADLAALQKELETKVGSVSTGAGGVAAGSFLQRKEYTQAGAFEFTVPEGVKKLRVTLVAGSTANEWSTRDGGYKIEGKPGMMRYQVFVAVVPGQVMKGFIGGGAFGVATTTEFADVKAYSGHPSDSDYSLLVGFGGKRGYYPGYSQCVENHLYPYGRVPGGTAATHGNSGFALIEW